MEYKSSRIGYLLSGGRIRSVGVRQGITESEFSYMSDVREWFAQQFRESPVSEDTSLISYFYRCMEEGTEFYYLYDETTGWRCGGVTLDTPLRGKLVPLDSARGAMEEWVEDLKYSSHTMLK
jgi:hypothetical protein